MSGKAGSRGFDPRPHLRRLENGAEYLDVKWRLAWMRSEHPNARIESELMRDDEDGALFKATVRLPDGGSATAHAGVARDVGGGHIERAETKAVGRALAALGYGAEYTEDDMAPARPAERAAAATPTPFRPARERPTEEDAPATPPRRLDGPRPIEDARRPDDTRPAEALRPIARPVDRDDTTAPPTSPPPEPRSNRGELRESPIHASGAAPSPSAPAEPARPASTSEAGGADSEDVSWNKFWIWAKRRGYRDANHLRELLGEDVMSNTPHEVRTMLRRYEVDHPPPGNDE